MFLDTQIHIYRTIFYAKIQRQRAEILSYNPPTHTHTHAYIHGYKNFTLTFIILG